MRIVAGSLKGRQFNESRGHRARPMAEKIRGALFNVLGDIDGLTFLDAFAGSGALSFESASRGAKSVTAIEKDRAAHSVIDRNIKELGLGKLVRAANANVGGWSIHNMETRFNIVLLDPPYDDLQPNLLQRLTNRHVAKGGLVVLSWPGHREDLPAFTGLEIVTRKDYGDAQLAFYRKLG